MKEFDRIKDLVYNELDEFGRYEQLNKEAVCMIGELVDILKDIGTVEMFEEENNDLYYNGDDGYSQGYSQGYSYRNMPRRYSYNGNGNSYRGGRSMNNGSSYGRRYRGGYSREDGKEYLIQKLENLMNESNDEQDRHAIQRLIDQMHTN